MSTAHSHAHHASHGAGKNYNHFVLATQVIQQNISLERRIDTYWDMGGIPMPPSQGQSVGLSCSPCRARLLGSLAECPVAYPCEGGQHKPVSTCNYLGLRYDTRSMFGAPCGNHSTAHAVRSGLNICTFPLFFRRCSLEATAQAPQLWLWHPSVGRTKCCPCVWSTSHTELSACWISGKPNIVTAICIRAWTTRLDLGMRCSVSGLFIQQRCHRVNP